MEMIDIEICQEEYHHEYVYSKLLENLKPMIKSILKDKTNWRL